MKQPTCMVCGRPDHLLADQSKTRFVCGEHVMQVRNEFAWGARYLTFAPYDTWLTYWQTPPVKPVLFVEEEKGTKKLMAANNKTEAGKEGKEFARLLGALVEKKKAPDFEAVADFASYCATNIVGYTDAERSNAYAKAFIGEWISQPKETPDTLNLDTVNTLRAALGMEPLQASPSLLTNGE